MTDKFDTAVISDKLLLFLVLLGKPSKVQKDFKSFLLFQF